ncbi:MAG: hypothetical protein HGA27_06815 [Peptococcaceae bacterium]|nr:hypothetical protein [Peptococcaceae bacterium]
MFFFSLLFISLILILSGVIIISAVVIIFTYTILKTGKKDLVYFRNSKNWPSSIKQWLKLGAIGLATTLLGMLLAVLVT